MEIKELESFYINEASQTLDVTFRIHLDNEDEIRTDQIDLSETETFGYNLSNHSSPDFFDDEEYEDIFDDDDNTELDEEEIISFLNEYYLIYQDRVPDTQLY